MFDGEFKKQKSLQYQACQSKLKGLSLVFKTSIEVLKHVAQEPSKTSLPTFVLKKWKTQWTKWGWHFWVWGQHR